MSEASTSEVNDQCMICYEQPEENRFVLRCFKCKYHICRPCLCNMLKNRFNMRQCPLCRNKTKQKRFYFKELDPKVIEYFKNTKEENKQDKYSVKSELRKLKQQKIKIKRQIILRRYQQEVELLASVNAVINLFESANLQIIKPEDVEDFYYHYNYQQETFSRIAKRVKYLECKIKKMNYFLI